MPRESGVALQKVTLNLTAGDKDILASYYSVMGWSVAARKIIHRYCEVLREKDSQEVQAGAIDLNVEMPSVDDLREV